METPTDHPEYDNESLRSETDGKLSSDCAFIALLVIIQNLYTLGMNSVHNWCYCTEMLKKDEEIRKDPLAMNIVFHFSSLAQTLEQNLLKPKVLAKNIWSILNVK